MLNGFFGQYLQKRSKTEKKSITIQFYILKLVWVPDVNFNNFDFLKQICHIKRSIVKKQKEWISPLSSSYFSYTIYPISAEFDNFHFLEQTCPKRVFPAEHQCKEYRHWVLDIRINLGSKFFPEQTNFNFWIKYAQKRYLGPKPKKMNIPIEYCILELV